MLDPLVGGFTDPPVTAIMIYDIFFELEFLLLSRNKGLAEQA